MNCSLLSLSEVFPSSCNNILLCILLLDNYIRFITLYHSFCHVLQGRSMSISPCNSLDWEQLVLFWFLRFWWVFVFLCSQCLMRTFIGAVRSLLSFAGGPSTWILCSCSGSHTLRIFHFRYCARSSDHFLNHVRTFPFEKESLRHLCVHLLPFLQDVGKRRWFKAQSFMSSF